MPPPLQQYCDVDGRGATGASGADTALRPHCHRGGQTHRPHNSHLLLPGTYKIELTHVNVVDPELPVFFPDLVPTSEKFWIRSTCSKIFQLKYFV